ncbi:hypothetical protein BGX20_009109 [Mortierella sp. AD010]|nr:hypothetical protein BGX20_009109 [Mortierella sp. AD010]
MTPDSTSLASSTGYRHHKKRSSSTFSFQLRSHMDTTHNNIYSNCSFNANHMQSSDYTGEDSPPPERSPKRKYIMRPWTNAEQESLYIAVEKLKLFGQWHEVKNRMNLDRTAKEIEEEYTRLYAEIPDSDQDWEMDHDHEQIPDHGVAPPTPSLTATSSTTPSARSSQDNMGILFDRSRELSSSSAPEREGEDDEEVDEEDIEDQYSHSQRSHHAPIDVRPARMVRVWTPEQSENLKNLIEVHFPGSYRINWVWVAAQMGNAFTRKQCKNKWEIMRRRMGTEDEINLLKRGYQEFGPSWGQIQEKYLPERSRGGISIMWDLLETREAEQQNMKKSGPRAIRGASHGRYHSMSSMRAFHRPGGQKESSPVFDSMGLKQDQQDPRPRRKRTVTSDIGSMDMSTHMFAPRSRNEGVQMQSHHPYTLQGNGVSRHARHGSDITSLHSSETWGDRSYPMTWTEPLTRRLEELVQQNFPNHQKVNWAKISALMGNSPVVSRDQCKRRWYLISQNNSLQHNHHNYKAGNLANDSSMAMETDQTETTAFSGTGSLAGTQPTNGHDAAGQM